ncbi:hypothetical protein PR003_g28920, partial [Phytophthora rubi]
MVAADDFDEMDMRTDTASERSSLDTVELGARLSQLSRAKMSVALNSAAPRGLPVATSKSKLKQKEKRSK